MSLVSNKDSLSIERLKQLVSYDQETGVFLWKNEKNYKVKSGDIVGKLYVAPDGYKKAMIDGFQYQQHRLAWFYVYGKWPSGVIDHINRNKLDNRISNLRDVTPAENLQNSCVNSNNKSGYKGIHFVISTGRWRAQLRVHGKRMDLGTYDTAEQASDAYIEGVKKYCTHHPY